MTRFRLLSLLAILLFGCAPRGVLLRSPQLPLDEGIVIREPYLLQANFEQAERSWTYLLAIEPTAGGVTIVAIHPLRGKEHLLKVEGTDITESESNAGSLKPVSWHELALLALASAAEELPRTWSRVCSETGCEFQLGSEGVSASCARTAGSDTLRFTLPIPNASLRLVLPPELARCGTERHGASWGQIYNLHVFMSCPHPAPSARSVSSRFSFSRYWPVPPAAPGRAHEHRCRRRCAAAGARG